MKLSRAQLRERLNSIIMRAASPLADEDFRAALDDLFAAATPPSAVVAASRIIFSVDGPYVTLGREGAEQPRPHPQLAGLDYAWYIFLFGVGAGSVLDAAAVLQSFGKLPGQRPGNTLRTRIKEAAKWVEAVAGCPELAAAMCSPSICISDEGAIVYDPSRHPPIRLSLL